MSSKTTTTIADYDPQIHLLFEKRKQLDDPTFQESSQIAFKISTDTLNPISSEYVRLFNFQERQSSWSLFPNLPTTELSGRLFTYQIGPKFGSDLLEIQENRIETKLQTLSSEEGQTPLLAKEGKTLIQMLQLIHQLNTILSEISSVRSGRLRG